MAHLYRERRSNLRLIVSLARNGCQKCQDSVRNSNVPKLRMASLCCVCMSLVEKSGFFYDLIGIKKNMRILVWVSVVVR